VLHQEHALSEVFVAFLLAALPGFKRIWSISSSIPAKSG
jgi:hypothetical protein